MKSFGPGQFIPTLKLGDISEGCFSGDGAFGFHNSTPREEAFDGFDGEYEDKDG